MESLVTDVRYGLRALVRAPGLAVVAILTIGLGAGLTTHTFSVVYGAMLRGLDFDRGTTLAAVTQDIPSRGSRGQWIPYLDLLDLREEQTVFRGLAAYTTGTVNLADQGNPPERYDGAFVSAEFFEQVDGTPVLGRAFTREEEQGLGEQVVVLGWDVWQNRYGGDPDIVGKAVRVNSESATVVGVAPEGFHLPFAQDVWLPLRMDPLQAVRGGNRYGVVGRLREGVTMEQADARMDALAARIAQEHPETNEGVEVWVQSYEEMQMPGEIRAVLWAMLAAVFGVLLVACFNVANLLLARATVRAREVAIRSALGADRGRLIRQLLVESALLALAGGALGVLLAWLGIEAFNAAIVDIEKPYWIDIRLDGPALAFTLAVTAFASLAAGAVPAVRASGAKLHEILQDQGRGSSSLRMGRFSSARVMGEIALSCALLVAAGMMVKSIVNVNARDLGFREEGLFTARVGLFEADYPDDAARLRFYDRLVEEVRAEPEALAVGLTTSLPALGSGGANIAIEGRSYPEPRDRPFSRMAWATPGYFEALDVSPVQGRAFTDQDRAGSVPVVVVNESFAQRHFPGEDPLGKRFRTRGDGEWLTVVGVVPDVYIGGGTGGIGSDAAPQDQFFVPLAHSEGVRFVSLVVRTRGEPGAFAPRAREIVRRLDPGLPLYWVRTMEEAIATGTWAFEVFGSLFAIFGVAALFLAAVGLYGVMAFSVGRRTQEMGIRMAMGAGAGRILRLVLGTGMRQLAVGVAIGLLLGALLARPLQIVFYDVRITDPSVYAAIVLTLGLSGLLACLVPARRATRVELVDALRPE